MQNKEYSKENVIKFIADVSLRSVNAKEILIMEIGKLGDLIPYEQAEKIRQEFILHKTPIKQITNQQTLETWTDTTELTENMEVKFIPADNFAIKTEILIFDDIIAMYRVKPDYFYEEICDNDFARTMRQFFFALWQVGDSLQLSSDGSTLTKQYLPIVYNHNTIPIIIYPAKDDGQIERAFSRDDDGCLEQYIDKIVSDNIEYYRDADIILAYIWNQDSVPYCDMWKINRNRISDDSGFLYDAKIYKRFKQISDMGVASGNTSIVLTAEEILLRDLVLKKSLSFTEAANRQKYHARFPAGYVPVENFYYTKNTP